MVTFTDLSWAALLNYYRTNGDKRYIKLMADKSFIDRLRTSPGDIDPGELEQKLVLDHVNVINFDLLMGCRLAEQILGRIAKIQPEVRLLQGLNITTVDPLDHRVIDSIQTIYRELSTVNGLWLTGVSKIAHVLNDQLLPIMGLDVIDRFPQIREQGYGGVGAWLNQIHEDALSVVRDFQQKGYSDTPEEYLSGRLGYRSAKSLVKFLDEYYWIYYGESLPLPPKWIPRDKEFCVI